MGFTPVRVCVHAAAIAIVCVGMSACLEKHPDWNGGDGSGSSDGTTAGDSDSGSDGSASDETTAGTTSSDTTDTTDTTVGESGGSTCGDGVLEAGEECDGDELDGTACGDLGFEGGDLACGDGCTFDTSGCAGMVTEQRIFMTSTTFAGNFGGPSVADDECQARADDAGLGGTWRAVISTSTEDARERVVITGLVRNLGNFTLARDADDLWDGINWNVGFHEDMGLALGDAWTGTSGDGTHSGSSCDDFSSNKNDGTKGIGYWGETRWLDDGNDGCKQEKGIYCLEQ